MVSVLVVNWNTRELLRACLKSLVSNPPKTPHEVIVVDNASSDGSAEMVRTEFPQVTLVASPRNLGYAEGNNEAWSRAQGEWRLSLNPDTEVPPGAIDAAVAKLEARADCAVLAPRLVEPGGMTQKSVRGFPTVWGILGDLSGLGKLFPGSLLDSYRLTAFDYETEQCAPQPMGTFLLYRQSAVSEIGDPQRPFDPQFPIFFNEVDLLLRLAQHGGRCLFVPDIRILHHGGASTKQVRKSMIWESHRSLIRFLRKHSRSLGSRLAFPVVAALIWFGALLRARGYDVGFRP